MVREYRYNTKNFFLPRARVRCQSDRSVVRTLQGNRLVSVCLLLWLTIIISHMNALDWGEITCEGVEVKSFNINGHLKL